MSGTLVFLSSNYGALNGNGQLAGAGVDFDDVTATLEREGVAAFVASYREAIATVGRRMERLRV